MKSTLGVKMFLAKYVLFIIGLQIEALFPATIFQGYVFSGSSSIQKLISKKKFLYFQHYVCLPHC